MIYILYVDMDAHQWTRTNEKMRVTIIHLTTIKSPKQKKGAYWCC